MIVAIAMKQKQVKIARSRKQKQQQSSCLARVFNDSVSRIARSPGLIQDVENAESWMTTSKGNYQSILSSFAS